MSEKERRTGGRGKESLLWEEENTATRYLWQRHQPLRSLSRQGKSRKDGVVKWCPVGPSCKRVVPLWKQHYNDSKVQIFWHVNQSREWKWGVGGWHVYWEHTNPVTMQLKHWVVTISVNGHLALGFQDKRSRSFTKATQPPRLWEMRLMVSGATHSQNWVT